MGLAWVLRKAAGYAGLGEPGDWWLNEEITAEADRKFRLYLSPVFISTSLLLFVIGLAHPLSVEWIPTRYTQEGLEERLSQVSLIEENLPAEGEQVVVYGKAIYPRFFEAGDHMADHRWGTVPESSYPRVEFYLVGTENTWAALPGEEGVEFFPHSSEILMIGTREPQLKNDAGKAISGEYIKASTIYIFDSDQGTGDPVVLSCSGENCQ